jgi:hypothetical protein
VIEEEPDVVIEAEVTTSGDSEKESEHVKPTLPQWGGMDGEVGAGLGDIPRLPGGF